MNQIETRQFNGKSDVEHLIRLAQQCAHDIRSPLSALNMLVSTLNHMSSEQRSLIDQVITRINDIADDLLLNSREYTPPVKPRPLYIAKNQTVRVHSLIEETKKLKSLEHQTDSIKTNIDVEKDLDIEINEVEIKRVLSNIINNSFDAGSTSVEIRAEKQMSTLILTIEDNGAGIPAEILYKIARGEQVTYGKPNKGNGIGLSHAFLTINNLGGSLTVDSKPGRGTTVKIYLLC